MSGERSSEELIQELCASPLGEELGEEMCRDLVERGDVVRWKRDSVIFQEGDAGTSIYVILEGRIKLTRYSLDGRETVLHLAERHRLIAEAVLFLGRYPVTAVTLEDTALLRIPSSAALELLQRHPGYMSSIFRTMSHWMMRLVEKIDRLTLHDARSRLIHYLLELHRSDSSSDTVTFPAKKGEISTMLNMDQATLSRVLRSLQDEKLIEVNGRTCRLLDVPSLKSSLLAPPPGDF